MSERLAAETTIHIVDEARRAANGQLNPIRKIELGQFMTPATVARFMAAMFTKDFSSARLLDAGAGVGSLTAAFIDRFGPSNVRATAYEIDATMTAYLRNTLGGYRDNRFEAAIINRDFIQDAVYNIKLGRVGKGFTHAILNPPYKKINSGSVHRALLRAVGLETVNLYAAFVGLAIELMAKGGELVAIVPRSFCNGLYYKPFREWIFERAALEQIHLFHSRTSAFKDDAVLQENVIIKLVRDEKQRTVKVTTSSDTEFSDLNLNIYQFRQVVRDRDTHKIIHVPTTPGRDDLGPVAFAVNSRKEIGIAVSTGPVVDFRLKEFLCSQPEPGSIPLLYPIHFSGGGLRWPRQSRKPNALFNRPEVRKWLYPSGFYTIVRRFSSKEERRRIIAHVVDPKEFETDVIGFENHLNVFHFGRKGLDREIAHGLSAFLNSTAVDEYFRQFSGHTQVNATDLRMLRYPALTQLRELGRWSQKTTNPTQREIDEQVEALHGKKEEQDS